MFIKKTALLTGAALFLTACISTKMSETSNSLDTQIIDLMADHDVKGMAVAVIEDGEITHVGAYGDRNVENALPLEPNTVMYGASLTKAAFAYMVLQLVDEDLIDLDTPLAEYLKKPIPDYPEWASLSGEEEWRRVTARHVLTHTTGLANLRFLEPDGELTFHFEPGTEYAYSGEGFWLLQHTLEEGFGLNIKTEMQSRIFDRFGMTRTDMQWRDDFRENLADGYKMDGTFEPHDERSTVSASGSMDTTIADQAHLWAGMVAGDGLSDASRDAWTSPNLRIKTEQKFPTIQMHATRDARHNRNHLAAGLGVETWEGPTGRTFAKGGHNDWTGNIVICQETGARCLIALGNDVRAELIFPDLAELVLGETAYPWWWTYPRLHPEG